MRPFKNLSINTKLNLLVTVAAGVAMLLSCGAFATNEYLMIRASKVQQLSALAEVLGSNSKAALIFDDSAAAKEVLSSLRMQPTVEYACLYNARQRVFADYARQSEPVFTPPPPGPPGHRFTESGYLDVTKAISREGEQVGTIYLHASMSDLYAQLAQYVNIVAVVMVVSMGGAILLSTRLHRAISGPILRLADTAQRISAEGDYSIRVPKEAEDELGTLYEQFNNMLDRIQRGERALQAAHDELELRVQQRTQQLSQTNQELVREIADRQRAEAGLEEAHERLLVTARQAGMAEIATGVLHNVGNVLNSMNVSATLIADRVRNSKTRDLSRAVDLLKEHDGELGEFLTNHEKGKLLPRFLTLLAEHLAGERAGVLDELRNLSRNVDHVKTIIAMQQSYAGVAGVVESVSLAELVEDALKLNRSSFEKYGIEIARQYTDPGRTSVDKQKLLQILINLITNAKDALAESARPDRRLTIRVGLAGENRLQIEVADNGVGIPKENLTRIFSHGFTTKRHGHGFGLHSSANAAKEIGGRLSAYSEGPQCGATFTVEVPVNHADALARDMQPGLSVVRRK